MRKHVFVILGLSVAMVGMGLLRTKAGAASGVRLLSKAELASLIGGREYCKKCKETAAANSEHDCQRCVYRWLNHSKKYTMGPIGLICKWTVTENFNMSCTEDSGSVICGEGEETGKWRFWDNNEDCLGVYTEEVEGTNSVYTASGTACPSE